MTRQAILLVDDDALAREVMNGMLRVLFPQLAVREAVDGEAALDLIDDDVLCVVTDIAMPRLDGLHLCWTIRNAAPYRPWRNVPVILVSALCHDASSVVRAWSAGTALLLRKPFAPADLARLVTGVTGVEAAVEPAAPARPRAAAAQGRLPR